MSSTMVHWLAMVVLGATVSCREVTIPDSQGSGGDAPAEQNVPAETLTALTGTAFLNFFHGQTEIKLTEGPATKGLPAHAPRTLSIIAGLGKSTDGTFELVDTTPDRIQSKTPTIATCRMIEPGEVPTEYVSRSGTLSITTEVDPDHQAFGRLRVHVDLVMVDEADPDNVVHVVGDATIPIIGLT